MTDHEAKPEPRQRFGRIPANLDIATLNRSELAVLMVLAQHIGGRKDKAWPSLSTLAARAGRTRRTVQRALRRLEARGVVGVVRGTGRGKTNTYTIIVKGDTQATPFNTGKGDTQVTPLPSTKGRHCGPQRVTLGVPKGDTSCVTRIEKKIERREPAARATAENIQGGKQKQPADCELWTALRGRGIGEPMCSRLASNPALTLAMVETAQGREGALVENLKEAIVKQSEIDERDRKRTDARLRETRERKRSDVEIECEARAAAEVLARFNDQQQAEAFGIMVSAPMPDVVRSSWLSNVPPVTLAKHLDPEGYECEYRKLLELPDLPAKDPQASMFGKMLRE